LHIFLQIEIITVSLSNAARKNMVIFNVIRGKITRILLVEVILIFDLSRNSVSAYTIKFFDKCSAKSNILSYRISIGAGSCFYFTGISPSLIFLREYAFLLRVTLS